MRIGFEYTYRDTPQQNHLDELDFATIFNGERSLNHVSNIPIKLRYEWFKTYFKTAIFMDGLYVIDHNGKKYTR